MSVQNFDVPKISIVTATYNQGNYIKETIESLKRQNYPNLEYVVIDGQSSDNTIEIVRKYEHMIDYWVSEPDKGAADAIEKGRAKCSGDLFNWLNSDDYLLPGTLLSLGAIARKFPDFDVYAFIGMGSGANGALSAWFSSWPNMQFYFATCKNPFAQESTFVKTNFISDNSISIRKEYLNWFDAVFYEELLFKGARVLFIDIFGGVIRHHPEAKTSIGAPKEDVVNYENWQKMMFPRKIQYWRRLSSTRLHKLLVNLCSSRMFYLCISKLLNRNPQKFSVCERVGYSCDDADSWELRH